MLKTIITNSPALLAFIAALQIALTKPQRQHVLNVVDGLVVGEGNKTLSALCRLFVDAPDPKAVADTFRESPWSAEMIRQALRRFLVKSAFMLAQATGVEHLVYLSIDDGLTAKDKATRHLEAVDWHHDHTTTTPTRPANKNGTVYVLCRLHVGTLSTTVEVRETGSATVPELCLVNRSDSMVLVTGREEVVGGKQNRMVNTAS